MARRRPAEPEELRELGVPEELVGPCWVEDWCDPRADTVKTYQLGEAHDVSWWAVHAWCRRSDARAAWLDQHAISREDRCMYLTYGGAPRFRDLSAFVAALRVRFPHGKRDN